MKISKSKLAQWIREEVAQLMNSQQPEDDQNLSEEEQQLDPASGQKVASLRQKKADLDKQRAVKDAEAAKIQQQIDSLSKK